MTHTIQKQCAKSDQNKNLTKLCSSNMNTEENVLGSGRGTCTMNTEVNIALGLEYQ